MASGSVDLRGKIIDGGGKAKVGLTVELWEASNWELNEDTAGSAARTTTDTSDSDGLWDFDTQDITKTWLAAIVDGNRKTLIDARNRIQLTNIDIIDDISVDTLYEHTVAAGVTIDSVKLKDGLVQAGNGAVGGPSLTVGSLTTGFYQTAADRIGIAIAGALDIELSANLLDLKDGTVLEMNEPIRWDNGAAPTGGNYEILRNADGTNLLQLNVPTGASFEFSVNAVTVGLLSTTLLDLKNGVILELNELMRWDTAGAATTAGAYQFGRDNSTVLHANVPTGATFEWSVNDVAIMTLSASGLGAITLNGAIAGGDQTWTNVGNMTFAAGSILASGGSNGNTLLMRANDTTFITFTTGATDVCTLEAITLKGTLLADGTVTMPTFTLGGTVTGNSQVMNSLGHIGVSTASSTTVGIIYTENTTITDNGYYRGVQSIKTLTKTSAVFSSDNIGVMGQAAVGAGNNQNWTAALGLIGVKGTLQIVGGATGTITGAANFWATTVISAALFNNWYGFYAANPTGAGAVNNAIGVYVESITKGGTSNYAIKTNAGLVEFGDHVKIIAGKRLTIDYQTSSPSQSANGDIAIGYVSATNRIYFYSNSGQHYVDQTAGVAFNASERVMFGHRWEEGDLGVVKIDHVKDDGSPHGLLYPFEQAVQETEWASTVEERLEAVKEANQILRNQLEEAKLIPKA